jgi:putative intracellular protease/amidase
MSPPTKYAVALFPGFQALDVFGPLDTLNWTSRRLHFELSLLHTSLEPVSTQSEGISACIGQSVVPTHTYDTAPEDIEVLIVPGGFGARDPKNTERVREFVKERYPKLRYLLTVCTGSVIVAQTGLLDGKNATSNKLAFDWVSSRSTTSSGHLLIILGPDSRCQCQLGKKG